jgi:hypothetical protein
VGTFEKSFVVDGEQYEVYSYSEDGTRTFQLVTEVGLPIGQPLSELPEDETVAALVREALGVEDEAA